MNNKIIKIQEMLFEEMKRLSDDEIMKKYGNRETSRSQALTQSAGAYIKAVNTSVRIKMLSNSIEKEQELLKELGIKDEKEN